MSNQVEKFPGIFPGTIKAPLDILSLEKTADVICEGEVAYVIDEGEVQYLVGDNQARFRTKVALFHVDLLHKGTIPSAVIEIEFVEPDFPSSMESLSRGEYVLIFLASTGTRYRFASLTATKLPVIRQPLPAAKGEASALARIRKTLTRSLAEPNNEAVRSALDDLGDAGNEEKS